MMRLSGLLDKVPNGRSVHALFGMVEQYKRGSDEVRVQLYRAYLKNTQWINNWDLVDVCSIHVVGGYLFDKPRKVLYKLARSKNMWERRTEE